MTPSHQNPHDWPCLPSLPAYDSDPRRARLIRDRCHAALAARKTRAPVWHLALDSAAAALSAAYLAAVLIRASTLYGF